MVMLVPVFSFDGIVPAAAAGLDSMGITMLVLAGLLCLAAALLLAARSIEP
jgi:hypothetical protein